MDDAAPIREPRARLLPRLSLRVRLTLWVVAIFTLIHWGSGGVFWLYQSAAIKQMYRDLLSEKVEAIAEPVSSFLPGIQLSNLETIARRELRWGWVGRYRLDVLRPDGQSDVTGRDEIFNPSELPLATALAASGVTIKTVDVKQENNPDSTARAKHIAMMPVHHEGGSRLLVVEVSDAFAQRQLSLLRRVLLLAGAIGPLAALVAGWFIAGVAVAPLERLRGFARNLGPESIGQELSFDEDDTTEVARLSRELEDARQRIQAAFEAQGRFLSNVSHEIKTPISVLMLEAQTLPRENMPEAYRDFLDSAKEEMIRLGALVESFLTLTRVQDGKGVPRELEYGANDLVMDSVDHCLAMAQQHHVRLAPLLLESESDVDSVVRGEPELLRTMLDNLIRNAIRFSPKGEIIQITLERVADELSVCVLDRGPGIPDDQLEVIFDRFAQTEDGKRSGRGHGLGLEIARGIAELHGGDIAARNRGNGGACFLVTLPVKPDQNDRVIADE